MSHSSAGGAQEIWANLAEGFSERGYEVVLAALYPYRATVRESAAHLPWSYIVPKRPSGPLAAIGLLRALVARFRRDRPEIVFTAMPAANVLASIAARLAGSGTRVVTSHHSPVETHNPALNVIDGVAGSLKSVKAVVSVSNTVAASLDSKPAPYRQRRRTIHNALPPRIETLIESLAQARRPRVARTRTVVATGRLAPQKNYPLLLRAAAHLPDATFKIVGNGPEEAALKALAIELGVQGRVEFLGHRPREEAMAILADGDVFVQASLFEGHSLALVEAAKLGLPLVVSDVPVQIEGITARDGQRCGLAVSTQDPEGLAATLRRLLDDPAEYAQMAALSAKLGSEASYAAMLDAYEALVA
ncbi:glycosyltransferase family 4 protein [Sphingosinicella sp. BN140058]|uniref:glycosyltransferase family 4 protein n=1 Tax=Sphingosinicella sp. BN140058 TaxID=1892855 RepID=UPI0013EA9B04|nr:glycosyltransferase family 4 protein [Sphingosinicella sp. BN140058]